MKVTHTFQFSAKCPVNDGYDKYECAVQTDRLIPVEDILEVTGSYAEKRIWHEHLCQQLADRLQCAVTIKGTHSGVQTEVTCEPLLEKPKDGGKSDDRR